MHSSSHQTVSGDFKFESAGVRVCGPTSGPPSLPLKNLVADSNNKLQSDRSIIDQLEPLKSLRMSGWRGKKINLQFTSG